MYMDGMADAIIKIILIGDTGVGKTNIMTKFTRNEFTTDAKSTIGVEFAVRTLIINNHIIRIQIWDTAGQERYRSITHAYYRGCSGVLIVYDITKKSTFDNLDIWLTECKKYINPSNKTIATPMILVGNKVDLIHLRAVKTEDGIEYAKKHNISFMETSALTSTNIEQLFDLIARMNLPKPDIKSLELIKEPKVNKPNETKNTKAEIDKKIALVNKTLNITNKNSSPSEHSENNSRGRCC